MRLATGDQKPVVGDQPPVTGHGSLVTGLMATAFTTRPIPTFSAVRRQPVALRSAAVRRRYIRHVATLVAVAVVFSLLFVWVRIQVIQLGYEVSRLRRETTELAQQKNRLEAEVEALKAPSRLEAIAREQLGMRLPMGNEIVFVGQQ